MPCDLAHLALLAWPDATKRPAVASVSIDERVGVRAVMHSRHSPEQWYAVLKEPEAQEEWQPPSFGVPRVDRLDPEHIYQQIDLKMLFGAVRIREQLVVRIEWISREGSIANCWAAQDPTPWLGRVPQWDAKWDLDVKGGWNVDPGPGGGGRVSYQVWASRQTLLPGIQEWAMSRTLPEMLELYDARVGELAK